jgi:hypothetical protein
MVYILFYLVIVQASMHAHTRAPKQHIVGLFLVLISVKRAAAIYATDMCQHVVTEAHHGVIYTI